MDWPAAEALLAPLAPWFEAERRALPWRALDLDAPHPDPFAVLVSELMLQQTQVATVIPYFLRWMERFPDAQTLAESPEEDVLKHWEGLGYYRRARHLHATAQRLARDGWPPSPEGLLGLPGLGPYTAAAIASIAFQWPAPALDGNAFRVLARLLGLPADPRIHARSLQAWLQPALRQLGPSRMTQAVMELGATLCTPSKPWCEACPVAPACAARRMGATAQIPPPRSRPKPKEARLVLLAIEADGAWLLRPPASRGLLAGLWQWPALPHPEEPQRPPASAWEGARARTFEGWVQVYTHRREQIRPVHLRLETPRPAPSGWAWVPTADLIHLPFGRRDQRLWALVTGSPSVPMETPGALEAGLLANLFGAEG